MSIWRIDKIFLKNRAKKDINEATKKTIYQCKIRCIRKKYIFFVRMYCYILIKTSLWHWKSLLPNFPIVWKLCPEILFLNLNLTVLPMRSDLFVSPTILCRLKQSYFVWFFVQKCTLVFSVTIVANIFRAFPRTLETFWWVTGHPGWVLGHKQRSCTSGIMFLTMFYSPLCSKSMLSTFEQVVEKMKLSLVTTNQKMD